MDEDSVGELLHAAAKGDQLAWDRIVGRYTGYLWAVTRSFRLDTAQAADVVQTTWLRLVEHLDDIAEPEHLGAWLGTTTRRECLRLLRRERREHLVDTDAMNDLVDPVAAPVDASLLLAEQAATLEAAFAQLGQRCQQLLRLSMLVRALSYEEMSAALDMPIGSIGPTRGRCLQRLRRLLAGVDV